MVFDKFWVEFHTMWRVYFFASFVKKLTGDSFLFVLPPRFSILFLWSTWLILFKYQGFFITIAPLYNLLWVLPYNKKCSFSLELLWLPLVFGNSIWILVLCVPNFWKMTSEIWNVLYYLCKKKFGSIGIFTILIFPMEHGIPFHHTASSLFSFTIFLMFSL